MIPITKHAKKRMKTRVGSKNYDELYGDALLYGVRRSEFKGDFRRYLDRESIVHKSDCIVYKNMIYWHRKNILITVYQVPMYHMRRIGKQMTKSHPN